MTISGAVVTKHDRMRDAAEDFVPTLEECGRTRADAASELAAIAVSLASEGDTDRASVLMEVSDSMCCTAESVESRGSATRCADAELSSD